MNRQSTLHLFPGNYWLRLITFALVVSAIAFLSLLIYFIQLQLDAFVKPRRISEVGTAAQLGRPYKDLKLTTSDGLEIAGWHVSGSRPEAVILVHGIDANRQAMLPQAAILAEAGYHLLLIDLRGHGRSDGDEATYGYREALDVVAAVHYLENIPEIEQIGALGTSFGGAAVARAAAIEPRLEAVVIESSYSSMADAVDDSFEDRSIFPKWLFAPLLVNLVEQRVGVKASQINSARDLAGLSPRAVMILHGTEDHLFPLHHAQKMYNAAGEPRKLWIIEGLGHSNPVIGREAEYQAQVVTFFDEVFAR